MLGFGSHCTKNKTYAKYHPKLYNWLVGNHSSMIFTGNSLRSKKYLQWIRLRTLKASILLHCIICIHTKYIIYIASQASDVTEEYIYKVILVCIDRCYALKVCAVVRSIFIYGNVCIHLDTTISSCGITCRHTPATFQAL